LCDVCQYKGGVMIAADTLASYGSLARFKDVQRLKAVGEHTVIGAGGEFSDFQVRQRNMVTIEGIKVMTLQPQ
jgi:20S proteasome subunit beta 7